MFVSFLVQLVVFGHLVQSMHLQHRLQPLLWKATTPPCAVSTMASEYWSEIVYDRASICYDMDQWLNMLN